MLWTDDNRTHYALAADGPQSISFVGHSCNIRRAASTFGVVNHSSQSSGRRITTDRFSSPGLCMRDVTGCSSAFTVSIAIASVSTPSDPFHARHTAVWFQVGHADHDRRFHEAFLC